MKAKKFTILAMLAFLGLSQVVNAQSFEWAKRMGGTGYDEGSSIAIDASGNVYITGEFGGTADFDPGEGTYTLTSAGGWDIFVSKFDSAGNFLWAKRMGGTGWDGGNSIAIDASGNVYITGVFSGTADFDPGEGTYTLTSAGERDIFVSKLDSAGNFVWARRMGGTGLNGGNSIAIDASGNVYITGYFCGTADFDPGAGTYTLTSAGEADIFVSKLDAAGNFVWAKRMGGTGWDVGRSIAIDASSNVYTTGWFEGTADFDPGEGTYTLSSAGEDDIFVSKLDAAGNFVWAKRMGGTDWDEGRSIAIDDSGNVYTTGYFRGTADFDPGEGTYTLTSAGGRDIFVSKLDAAGNFLWARRMGGTYDDYGRSIAIDASGNVYTTGYFLGTADFDPGEGTYTLTSAGGRDIFVSKLDAAGNFVWAKRMGGTDWDEGYSIAIDTSGYVYTTGYFEGTADFDPGEGTYTLTSAGGADIFVHKMSPCTPTYGTDVVTACDSYTWIDGNTYTASTNTPTFTLTNAAGCDSVVTLNLTINSVTDITTTIDGNTITANNSSATYQWLDCDNDYAIIPGETNQSFTATANGSYAVELTENGCVDTSACVSITTVGIDGNYFDNLFSVYPNPTNGKLYISVNDELDNVQVTVRNIKGREIYRKLYKATRQIELNFDYPAGVYILELWFDNRKSTLKLIKE
ncbi:MAG TPA: T9SS type A sorting domain-containing protein [Bacteroidales bacterium]|nr:T9SS type A sorting domain-containing protein [Bacteroidales bacterium]